jgi:hypothetical protein
LSDNWLSFAGHARTKGRHCHVTGKWYQGGRCHFATVTDFESGKSGCRQTCRAECRHGDCWGKGIRGTAIRTQLPPECDPLGRLTKIGDFLSSSGNRISYFSSDSLNRRPMVDWTVCIGSVRPREKRSHDGESQNCASWHRGVAEEKRLADLRWRAHTNHVHRVLRRHHCDITVSRPGLIGNNPFKFHGCRRFHGERPIPGERDVR